MKRSKKDEQMLGWLAIIGLLLFPFIQFPWLIPIVAVVAVVVIAIKASGNGLKLSEKPALSFRQVKKINSDMSRKEIKAMTDVELQIVDNMVGSEFEQYVVELLKYAGYSNVAQTPISGDYGVDVIAYYNGSKYLFQCKRFANKLGNKPIQEVYSGKQHYGGDFAAVITNNYFTKSAQTLANDTGVILLDRDQLRLFIENYVQYQ